MKRSKLEQLISEFAKEHNLEADFVQETEGLVYVRFCVGDSDD